MKFIKDWVVPILIGTIIAFTIQSFFGIANVNGHSMDPTLKNGEKIILVKKGHIHRFSVIVFNATNVDPTDTTGMNYVKRVIGVPGDEITYQKNGDLKINNKLVKQSFISTEAKTKDTLTLINNNYPNGFDLKTLSIKEHWTTPMTSNKIPNGYYFVMGDNRKVSNDSRYWGLVPKDKILGTTSYSTSFQKIK